MIDLHLSTIGDQAAALAREHGLGIEVAEFSYAVNMDTNFEHWEEVVRKNLAGIKQRILHAPFSELCPSAVEPLVIEITRRRLEQGFELARHFNIERMVVHTGYIPRVYFTDWFAEGSARFWCDFLADKPSDFTLLLENVFEEKPEIMRDIVEKTGDERLQLCLDVGHAGGASSDIPLSRWITTLAPYLGHVHIHNNYQIWDEHNPPGDGLIDIDRAINEIIDLRPDATFTAEMADLSSAVSWFKDHGFLDSR